MASRHSIQAPIKSKFKSSQPAKQLLDDNISLKDLEKELSSAKNKWYEIGSFLKIDGTILASLKSRQGKSGSAERRLHDVLSAYIDIERNPRWSTIVDCLRSAEVDYSKLADKIDKRTSKKVSDINKWAQIGSGDHQRAFKIVSLYDSHKLDAPKPSIPFAILNKKKDIIELNEEALKLLKKITKPVAVLTISGPYRTGKSYFLSRVLGDKPVFETSEEMDPCTKGMTMATMVLDCGDFVIVLFDTEGTDSIGEQPGEVAVSNFIILSSLLSSVLVYNSQGTPKRSDVDKMSFFAQLTDKFSIRSNQESTEVQECEYRKHLPDFLWLIRDLTLLVPKDANGKEQTLTQHIETKILSESSSEYNSTTTAVRKTLLTLYSSFKCMKVPPPNVGNPAAVTSLNELDDKFNQAIFDSIRYIHSVIKPRTGIDCETQVDGILLAELARNYVIALNKEGAVPNLEVSYESAVESKLRELSHSLSDSYQEEMKNILKSGTPRDEGDLKILTDLSHPASVDDNSLFGIHHGILKAKYDILRQEAERYMGGSVLSVAKDKILSDFVHKIVKVESGIVAGGCILHSFIAENRTTSRLICENVFIQEYNKQEDDVDTKKLKQAYLSRAIGPAKHEVLQTQLGKIPTPPQEFEAPEIGVSEIKLSWKIVNHDLKYDVQLKGEDNRVYTHNVQDASKIPITINKLNPHKKYLCRVRAHGPEFAGEFSAFIDVKTHAGKPAKPKPPTVVPENPKELKITVKRLTLQQLHGAETFDIIVESAFQKSTDSTCTTIKKWDERISILRVKPESGSNIPIKKTICLHSVPIECSTIYFRVRVVTIGGENYSDLKELSVKRLIPGPPTNPIYELNSEKRTATVSWSAPIINATSVKHYKIEMKEHLEWKQEYEIADNTCMCKTLQIKPATSYCVKLTAYNFDSVSSPDNEVKFTTDPAKPERPRSPKIMIDTDNILQAKVFITRLSKEQENGSPISSIIIQKAVGEKSNWAEEKHSFPAGDRSVQLTIGLINITEKKRFYCRVVMVNEVGRSLPSSECELEYSQLIPGRPCNIHVLQASNNSITLEWDPPEENPVSVDYYIVEKKETASTVWTIVSGDKTLKECTFIAEKLKQNSSYDFRVIAVNKDNLRSNESCVISARTRPCPPNKPNHSSIKLEILNHTTAKIRVPKPCIEETGSDITALIVDKCNDEGKELPELNEKFNCPDTEHDKNIIIKDIKLNHNVHYLRVYLENKHGISPRSEYICVSMLDVIPGAPNVNDIDSQANVTHSSVVLKWKRPKKKAHAAKEYEIEMTTDKTLSTGWQHAPYIHRVCEFEHMATIEKLSPKTEYFFRVYALNGELKSDPSEIVPAKTIAGRPSKPQKPRVSQLGNSPSKACIVVSKLSELEENGSSVTKLRIERNVRDCIWDREEIMNLASSEPVLHFEIMLPNIEDKDLNFVTYRVKMVNDVGESEPSDSVSIKVSDLQPGVVKDLVCTQNSISAHSVSLSWKRPSVHPAIVDSYTVEQKETKSEAWKEISKLNSNHSSYKVTNLQCYQEYHFRVLAHSKTVKGSPQIVTAKTLDITPLPPTNLRSDKVWSDAFKVRWNKPIGNTEVNDAYRIAVKDKKCSKTIKVHYTRGHSKVVRELESFTTYTVEVSGVSRSKRFSEHSSVSIATAMSNGARLALTVVGSAAFIFGGVAAHHGLKPDDRSHIIDSDEECDDDYSSEYEESYQEQHAQNSSDGASG